MIHFNLSRFFQLKRPKKVHLKKKTQTKTQDTQPEGKINCEGTAKTSISVSDSGSLSSNEQCIQNLPHNYAIESASSTTGAKVKNSFPKDETPGDVSYPLPPLITQSTKGNDAFSGFAPTQPFPPMNRSKRIIPPLVTTGSTLSATGFPSASFSPWASPVPSTCSFESSALVSEMDETTDFFGGYDSHGSQ